MSPIEHLHNLEKYLQAVPHAVPRDSIKLHSPTLRHPCLHPNNVFVSDDLEITGLIYWQHSPVLTLFLQCSIPNTFQNFGDSVSDSLTRPELPEGFDELTEKEQYEQIMLLRWRQLHFFYIAATMQYDPMHADALSHDLSTLRQKLFISSGSPWEGDNSTFEADLVELAQEWSSVTTPSTITNNAPRAPCPVNLSRVETEKCLRLKALQNQADEPTPGL